VVTHGSDTPSFLAGRRARLIAVAVIVLVAAVGVTDARLRAEREKSAVPSRVVVWGVSAKQPDELAPDGVVRIGVVIAALGGREVSLHGLRFGFGNATAVPAVDLSDGARHSAVLEFPRQCWLLPGSSLVGVPMLRVVDGGVAVVGTSGSHAPAQVPLRIAEGGATLLGALTAGCMRPQGAVPLQPDIPLRVVTMSALPDGSLTVVTTAGSTPAAGTAGTVSFSVRLSLAAARWRLSVEPTDAGTVQPGRVLAGYRVRLGYDCSGHGRVLTGLGPVLIPEIRSGGRVWSESVPGWDPRLATTVALATAVQACS